MNDITKPLILWRGSHQAGSGKGCAMNVISWQNGDKTITDYPSCSDRALASIVQSVNDYLAQDDGSLTAEDSMRVLDLGHATVGTTSHSLSGLDLRRVYARLASYAARKVVHLAGTNNAMKAIVAAEAWAESPNAATRAAAAAARADAAEVSPTCAASRAARYAALAAADAHPHWIAAYNVNAAYAAACAAAGGRYFWVELAAELIDLFKSLVPLSESGPLPVSPDEAIRNLQEVY